MAKRVDESRPLVMTGKQVDSLEAIAAYLERQAFKAQAAELRQLTLRWDQSEGFSVIHKSAFSLHNDDGKPVLGR